MPLFCPIKSEHIQKSGLFTAFFRIKKVPSAAF
nr:MAG TPA: hypothetical protein [Bacteriophage sp.]